ncbi:bifunctional glycosyltransferase family 2/GtrA family protein [Kineosporia sp. J2-2]|uniref:dolichyl-phosphate beta-glucosyltransferase n=1 Tax=Kineosporia corallincola TaxID=2835133 RepID=A0ABS5TII7_9ACTN|nr:bifunctional glycosyltransferase family 2/GtrA family protein [Kineosporia corallincola]MBT0770911.1 bifunctional glycosyltransferase family 2/GtrA family protein [Kineosporia corallincola]
MTAIQTTPGPDAQAAQETQPNPAGAPHQPLPVPALDVVVPVYNEEAGLEPCVERLHAYLAYNFPYRFRITIADNASVDSTFEVATRLAARYPEVEAVHLDQKGRGRALRAVWSASDAAVLAYMDVDLSTDLTALLPLVAPLLSGHSELAIGSRLAKGSRVVRGTKREIISRCYNLILRGTLAAGFTDAQCGFKAIRGDVAKRLLPLVEDTGWFFDTELLVLAERSGLRIHEVPVDWVDDPDSRVDIVATATADLKGVARVARALTRGELPIADIRAELSPAARRAAAAGQGQISATGRAVDPDGVPPGLTGQLIRFATVGLVSTVAYAIIYALLRYGMGAQAANIVALLITTIGNTAANRSLTFGVHGPDQWLRHQVQGLAIFALTLLLTSGSLALLGSVDHYFVEVTVLVLASALATFLRFTLLRTWVFKVHR